MAAGRFLGELFARPLELQATAGNCPFRVGSAAAERKDCREQHTSEKRDPLGVEHAPVDGGGEARAEDDREEERKRGEKPPRPQESQKLFHQCGSSARRGIRSWITCSD